MLTGCLGWSLQAEIHSMFFFYQQCSDCRFLLKTMNHVMLNANDIPLARIFRKVQFSFVLKTMIFVSLIFLLSIETEKTPTYNKTSCVKFSFQSIAERKKRNFDLAEISHYTVFTTRKHTKLLNSNVPNSCGDISQTRFTYCMAFTRL